MKKLPIILLSIAVILGGCRSYTPFLYQHDVVQGNIFSDSQIASIQNGLQRNQVHLIIGSPTVTDVFHPDQETYYFLFKSGDTQLTYKKSLTINYDANDRVINKQVTPLTID